ncbi:MAG: extracellular solute-binding protein [Candidatus Aureabacteria bacterium]|nr:extracellular solute-binding protein [Candidatus Auribacterota bacterium]
MKKTLLIATALMVCLAAAVSAQEPATRIMTLATTTSVENSGLLDALLPRFEKESGIKVKVVAVGTGAALRIAREGNADLVFVHDPKGEEKFVSEGFGTERIPIMYNYFWIVGPAADPAGIKGLSPEEAFRKIASAKAPFVSRGDKSGTNEKELALWGKAGVKPSGEWYLESGQGMIETLRIAAQKGAYTLTDNATYLFHRKDLALAPLISSSSDLLINHYSLIPLNPAKSPRVKKDEAQALVAFFRSPPVQSLIAAYGKEKAGEPLFYINSGQ